jgi:hypothetical protein
LPRLWSPSRVSMEAVSRRAATTVTTGPDPGDLSQGLGRAVVAERERRGGGPHRAPSQGAEGEGLGGVRGSFQS